MDAADRFLNCVIKRSDFDSLFRVGAILMLMVLVPLTVIFIMLQILVAGSGLMDTGVTLVAWTAVLYILYLEVKGLNSHCSRDAEWMASLAAYARSRGRGTDELDSLAESASAAGTGRIMQATKYTFIAFAVANTSMAVFTSDLDIGSLPHTVLSWAATAMIAVELVLTSIYILKTVSKHDSEQCAFTSLFVEDMGDVLGFDSPMVTDVTKSKSDLLPHILLLAVTLGIYSLFFNLFVVHRMNLHISCQWAYEEDLLEAMAKAEGATDVRRIERSRKKSAMLMDMVS